MTARKAIASLALAALTCATDINAESLVDATDPEEVLNVAKGFGSARLTEDGVGDPMITGRIEGTKYRIHFYMCEDNRDCKDIQFMSGWTGTDVTLEDVNRWNNEMRFGSAYIDEDGDPILTYVVNLMGGVSYDNLEDSFDWWRVTLGTFVEDVLENTAAESSEFEAD